MANPLVTPITIIAGLMLPTSAPGTPQFTATKKTVVKWIEMNNTDTVDRTLTFYNGTVTDANKVFTITLAAAEHQAHVSSAIVEIGGILVLVSDVAAKVRAAVYGATYEMA